MTYEQILKSPSSRRTSNARRLSELNFRAASQNLGQHFTNHDDAAAAVRSWCEKQEGSVLRAWLKYFDPENELSISSHNFSRGLRQMGLPGLGQELLKVLDEDGSGAISLKEIDPGAAQLWSNFRKWCAAKFDNQMEMLASLKNIQFSKRKSWAINQHLEISFQEFSEGLDRLGWKSDRSGDDEMLFKALDGESTGVINEKQLAFHTLEKRWLERKNRARVNASYRHERHGADNPVHLERAREKFKAFLKRKFGGYIRAWRCALSPGGSMTLQKSAFLKACSSFGYNDNLKLLWKAFDKDDSNSISIDELDLLSAEVLADFQKFVKSKFGSSAQAFRAFDMDGTRRVPYQEFAQALIHHDFHRPAKMLFHGLDRYGRKAIVEDDLRFLDDWKPIPFLTTRGPNAQAAAALREILLTTHRTYLKGWRRCLDVNTNNHCNWVEFEAGCRKLGFKGDVCGAWRALDPDLKGYITLHQIDPVTSKALYEFRLWAEHEFGCISSAFEVFDDDGSKEIALSEFVKCCHIYSFEGNPHQLFHALDINRDRYLSYKELTFLEHWVFHFDVEEAKASRQAAKDATKAAEAVVGDGKELQAGSGDKLRSPRQGFKKMKTVAEQLGREDRKSTCHLGLLPRLQQAASQKEEEVIEPMALVTMDKAEPLYAHPPYRLARNFGPRLGIDMSEASESDYNSGGLLRSGLPSHLSSTRSLASSVGGAATYTPVVPQGMPTLDDLLLPVADASDDPECSSSRFYLSHALRAQHRRLFRRPKRSRGRGKLAALGPTVVNLPTETGIPTDSDSAAEDADQFQIGVSSDAAT